MFISKKYITIFTGEPMDKYGPKLYLDFFKLKANLKRNWRDNSSFQIRLGLFDFHLCVILDWGFIERERTEEEEDLHQKVKKFIEELNK